MEKSIFYTVADITIRVDSEDAEFLSDAQARHETGSQTGDPALTVRLETAPEVNRGKPFQICSSGDRGYEFLMEGVQCRMAPERGATHLKIVPDVTVFEYVLQMLFSEQLLRNQGGIFHAAGLVRGGRGYIFAGPHGAGKSTVAACCPSSEILVLDDETAVVRQVGDGAFYLFPSPAWMKKTRKHGPFCEKTRVAGCFFLIQDSRVFLEQQAAAATVQRLFENLRFVLPHRSVLEAAMRFLNIFHTEVLTAELHFTREDKERFWDVIDRYSAQKV